MLPGQSLDLGERQASVVQELQVRSEHGGLGAVDLGAGVAGQDATLGAPTPDRLERIATWPKTSAWRAASIVGIQTFLAPIVRAKSAASGFTPPTGWLRTIPPKTRIPPPAPWSPGVPG
jgi:hypothetical protein